jgi:hypothetical protein
MTLTLNFPEDFDASRRVFLNGILATLGAAAIADLTVDSEILLTSANEVNCTPEALFDDITPLQKEVRRLMGIASIAQDGIQLVFTDEEVTALAVAAGCDFAIVPEGAGEALRIKLPVQVVRKEDGTIAVYENGILMED